MHGTHIVVSKRPDGFSRFVMTTFDKPYIHPFYRILSLGYGDLDQLKNSCYPIVDPRVEMILPLHDRASNRTMVSLWAAPASTSCTRSVRVACMAFVHFFHAILYAVCFWKKENKYMMKNLFRFSWHALRDLWRNIHQGAFRPETVARVALNRVFELHGPEMALCWAYRLHLETALTSFCFFLTVYKIALELLLPLRSGLSGADVVTYSNFYHDSVCGFIACAVWAPYTLNQWNWVQTKLLNEWDVSESLLTDGKNPFFRKTVWQTGLAGQTSWKSVCCCRKLCKADQIVQSEKTRSVDERVSERQGLLLTASTRHTSVDVVQTGDADANRQKAWDLKVEATKKMEAASPAADARASHLYAAALVLLDGTGGASPTCVCGGEADGHCECGDMREQIQRQLHSAMQLEEESRDHQHTTTGFDVKRDWTLPPFLITIIDLVMVTFFVFSLAALNGVLLFMEYGRYNILPPCESHFYSEFWSVRCIQENCI